MNVTVNNGDTVSVVAIPNGPPGPAFATAWGSFYDLTEQTNDQTVNTVTFSDSDPSDGVTVENGSEITVPLDGVYNLQFSIVAEKTGGGGADIDIWAAVNGNDVPNTNTRAHLAGNGAHVVLAWNLFLDLTAGDYVELRWYSATPSARFPFYDNLTNPTRPDIPSVIATVMRIADLPGD